MRTIILILLLVISYQAYSFDQWENKVFSGVFVVESCSPSCELIGSGESKFYSFFNFEKIEGIRISIDDKMDTNSIVFKPCDGSKQPFEFNLWTFGRNDSGTGYQTGHFMNNNYEFDSGNPWRNICDGKFSSSDSMVSLVSPDINIKLKKITDEHFELSWIDARWGISGVFKLKKNWYY